MRATKTIFPSTSRDRACPQIFHVKHIGPRDPALAFASGRNMDYNGPPAAPHWSFLGDKGMRPRLRFFYLAIAAILALFATNTSQAEVKPTPLFTDNMVLQRDRPVKVWGTAAADEKVKVSFGDQT